MTVIRLTRIGSKKRPHYRVVVADSRSPRDGRFIEILGSYNPRAKPPEVRFREAEVVEWLKKGAKPSERVARLLRLAGISAQPKT